MASSLDAATLFGVNGLVVFVTGAATGIGAMYAKALAQNGASKIYIGGRRLEKLQELAQSIGPIVIPIQCDVTSKDDISKAVDVIEKDSGYLNLLVANAGVNGAHPGMMSPDVSLEEFSERNFGLDFDQFGEAFRVNVTGVWFCAMAFLKLLDKGNKKGNLDQSSQVIVTSSISSYTKRLLSGAAYGQSKAAVNALIKQLAMALPKWKIRVNGIAPGLFPSEMSAPLIEGLQLSGGSVPQEMVPIGRLGEEKDMAAAILYLASQGGAYCNGNVIIVDGGRLQLAPATF